jgi:hypothetical protein
MDDLRIEKFNNDMYSDHNIFCAYKKDGLCFIFGLQKGSLKLNEKTKSLLIIHNIREIDLIRLVEDYMWAEYKLEREAFIKYVELKRNENG